MNYGLLQVSHDRMSECKTAAGNPKRGFAMIVFQYDGEKRLYDLSGKIVTHRKFENWAKKEFGYLAYRLTFG